LLKQPQLVAPLVDRGCLMQVTCGSLTGTFGAAPQRMAEWMLEQGLVHFLATDAHGPQARRPLMRHAYRRAEEIGGDEMAVDICCRNPADVAAGREVQVKRYRPKPRSFWAGLFRRREAA
jgi:protein-tyrosine phosphatase